MSKHPRTFGPTQKDVADALGLAQTTVGLALNPKYQSRYSPATVQRIQEKAREMGYRPQRHAQIMRGRQSRVVGILVHMGIFESSRKKLEELILAFRKDGYLPIVAEITWFNRDMAAAIDYLLDYSIEGLALLSISQECDLTPIRSRNIPIVAFNCNRLFGGPIVNEDIENAFTKITRHHLALGSRRLALTFNHRSTDPEANKMLGYTITKRLSGFVKAIHAEGGTFEIDFAGRDIHPLIRSIICDTPAPKRRKPGLVGRIIAPPWNQKWTTIYEVGRNISQILMKEEKPPQSIICDNDDMAMGILRGCLDLGIRLPEQVRLSGYDATEIGAYAAVPLTTYSPNNAIMAAKTVEILLSHIARRTGTTLVEENHVIRGSLIKRASTLG